jgi:hypothetical protein
MAKVTTQKQKTIKFKLYQALHLHQLNQHINHNK